MLQDKFENYDKLLMLIFDINKQVVVECLFFDSLKEYADFSIKMSKIYEGYQFYKLPVKIDSNVNIKKTNIFTN